ncbi:hypothetical protein [Lysinibacillus fusiformis]|uniref:hypothetical protein n=1 Tax=Lysinibacillus fusiformis TaxID=28031 RepID=UPI003D0313BE
MTPLFEALSYFVKARILTGKQPSLSIFDRENGIIDKGDVRIIGAVVSGTPEQLKSLQGQTYIKASTFGVISNQK